MPEILKPVFGIVFGLLFMQGLAGAVAYAFHNWGRRIPPRSRIIYSALVCGLLMVLIPIVAIMSSAEAALVPLAAMLFGALVMGLVSMPGAWWVTTRLERIDRSEDMRKPFE